MKKKQWLFAGLLLIYGTMLGQQKSTSLQALNDSTGIIQSNPVLPSSTNGFKSISYGEGNTFMNCDNTAYKISFNVNNSEKMNINNNGNVGIGTTSPTSTLNIVGNTSSYIPSTNGTQIISGAIELAKSTYPYIDFNGWTLGSQDYDSRIILYNENLLSFLGAPIGINYTTYNSNYRLSVGGNSYLNGNGYITGNLGLGTTSPSAKLHVEGNSYFNGNVGIGTVSPTTSFDVYTTYSGGYGFTPALKVRNNTGTKFLVTDDYVAIGMSESELQSGNGGPLVVKGGATFQVDNYAKGINIDPSNCQLSVWNPTAQYLSIVFPIRILGDLTVQTGDLLMYSSGLKGKFTQDGKIWAQEIVVQATDPWPDFVFNSEYKSMPLNELEKFVKTNNHLPDVPSACEVAENGVNLTKMDASLLQKIEELTLYIIELKKEIETIKSEKP